MLGSLRTLVQRALTQTCMAHDVKKKNSKLSLGLPVGPPDKLCDHTNLKKQLGTQLVKCIWK